MTPGDMLLVLLAYTVGLGIALTVTSLALRAWDERQARRHAARHAARMRSLAESIARLERHS